MTSLSVEMRAKHEASPSARRRDAPDATGRLKSFNVEGQGSRALPRSSCMACPSLMRAVRVRAYLRDTTVYYYMKFSCSVI